MTLSRIASRIAFGALAAGAAITLAAPLLPLEQAAEAGDAKEETTITITTSKDREATVLKLEPMKPGETKTVTAESGREVTVTRTGDGYTIRTGEKEIHVKTFDGEGPHVLLPGGREVHVVREGHCGQAGANMVFTGEDGKDVVVKKRAYAFRIGDGAPAPSAADVLKEAAPKSLETLDSRTRGAVEQVLQEMLDSGAVLAPGPMNMTWVSKDGAEGDAEKIRVKVIQKTTDEKK